MPIASNRLASPCVPFHLRPRREKVFGLAGGIPLDRNAKARIMAYAKGYNARNRDARQHWGPITPAFMRVLEALLYGFHNSKDGRCFPSYEAISGRAGCGRSTVYAAIMLLERIGLISWVNRIWRLRERIPDLFGPNAWRWRIVRTSNAYVFRDPLPCAARPPDPPFVAGNLPVSSKSENHTGTLIPALSSFSVSPKTVILDPKRPLDAALIRLGTLAGALEEAKA